MIQACAGVENQGTKENGRFVTGLALLDVSDTIPWTLGAEMSRAFEKNVLASSVVIAECGKTSWAFNNQKSSHPGTRKKCES
jgi:hypothetical protein